MDTYTLLYPCVISAMMILLGAFGGMVNFLLVRKAQITQDWNWRELFMDIVFGIAGAILSPAIIRQEILYAGQHDPITLLQIAAYILSSAIVSSTVIQLIPSRIFNT